VHCHDKWTREFWWDHIGRGVEEIMSVQSHNSVRTQKRRDRFSLARDEDYFSYSIVLDKGFSGAFVAQNSESEFVIESGHVLEQTSRVIADAAGL